MNVDYGKKENRERPADVMTLKEFLNIYNYTDCHLVDSLPDALQPQFQLPQCILCGGFTDRLTVKMIFTVLILTIYVLSFDRFGIFYY